MGACLAPNLYNLGPFFIKEYKMRQGLGRDLSLIMLHQPPGPSASGVWKLELPFLDRDAVTSGETKEVHSL